MKTAESVSPIDAAAVGTSLVVFILVYFAVFGAGTFYALRLMATPPQARQAEETRVTRTAGITPGPTLETRRTHHN